MLSGHPQTRAGDQLLGEHLAELAGMHQRSVRVSEHHCFGLRAIKGEQGVVAVEPPEVRRGPCKLDQPLLHVAPICHYVIDHARTASYAPSRAARSHTALPASEI